MHQPVVVPDSSPQLTAMIERHVASKDRIKIHDQRPDKEELIRRLAGHQIAIVHVSHYDEEVLRRSPSLRALVYLGTGASTDVDLAVCERLGITVRTIADYGSRTLAEHTLALLFAVYRDLGDQHLRMRTNGTWGGRPIGELKDKTIGIIGTGSIGTQVAGLAAAVGMKVVGWSRRREKPEIDYRELDELLRVSDIISLHLALTPETRGIIGARELDLLRPGAVLVNTARGALIDTLAMIERLNGGRLAGAGLDVFDVEPVPADDPIRSAKNVVLSCHRGWDSPEALVNLFRLVSQTLDEEIAKLDIDAATTCGNGAPSRVLPGDAHRSTRPKPTS